MNELRQQVDLELKESVVPLLRKSGFKGSMPHFRKVLLREIALITFQFDRWGGGFVVEVAECPLDGIEMHWGEIVPPKAVTAHHVTGPARRRISPFGAEDDYWYKFGKPSTPKEAVASLLPVLQLQIESWSAAG